MRFGLLIRRSALVVALASFACTSEVPIPEAAQFACTATTDCPAGYVCHAGLCARADALDTTPPELAAAPRVEPAAGRAGTTFTIDLDATEPLASPPEVTLALVPPVVVSCSATNEDSYRCSYTATGSENGGVGGAIAFDVKMIDKARNETVRKLAGALNVDLIPPVLAAVSVAPERAGLGAAVQVFLTVSEPLGAEPVLVASMPLDDGLGPATRFPLVREEGTLNYVFEHHVVETDPVAEVDFTAELTDAAGNVAKAAVGRVSIDNVVPVLTALSTTPARVAVGGVVTVSFAATKAVQPTVTIGELPLLCDTGPTRYTCARTLTGTEIPPDTEQGQSVFVKVVDTASNVASESDTVVFDFRAPRVSTASVYYVPDQANPLQMVSRAAATTRIRVAVVADEALDLTRPPTLVARNGASALPFAVVPSSMTSMGATFEAVPGTSLPDGTYVPEVVWCDLAGNTKVVTFATPTIRVKTSPTALAVDQARVTYLRSPGGNAVPETAGAFTIPAGPYFALAPSDPLSAAAALPAGTFSAGPATVASVRIWADGSRAALLGTMSPNVDGSWPRARLANFDAPAAWATALDDAGNESSPVRIANAEWVATSNVAALATRPHKLFRFGTAGGSRAQETGLALEAPPELAGSDGTSVMARSEALWTNRTVSITPPSRRSHAVAYDSGRGRIVLFGGVAPNGSLQDTWEWDGSAWTKVASTGPGPRFRAALAYDAQRGRTVLFGGTSATGDVQDTWEWDGIAWREVATSGPSARDGHALSYDSARGRVVLFGGWSGGAGGYQSDTWEWDGRTWERVSMAGPEPRDGHALAYDGARGRVVLFAGRNAAGPLQDTWSWDGVAWQKVATGGPDARSGHALAYDPARGRAVLFGGTGTAGDLQDTWEWDGSTWFNLTAAVSPTARGSHAVAYDALRARTVLFGGADTTGDLGDTWEWDGVRWKRAGTVGPGARFGHAVAFDCARQRAVLFGGSTLAGYLQDTWEWDGAGWQHVNVMGPEARDGHAMVFDTARRRVVLFGGYGPGYLQDTWEWDGSAWSRAATTGPSPRYGHALAYDSARGRTVLFGGTGPAGYLQDTWEWDGSVWSRVAIGGPAPRNFHAMAYDVARGRTVLFGGSDPGYLNDTWQWDGASWVQVSTDGPSERGLHALAYDAARARTVLFGGAGATVFQDVWEWDGHTWAEITSTRSPNPRFRHAMAYDVTRDRMLLVGGSAFGGPVEDVTWDLDASPTRQPAVQFEAGSLATGIDYARVSSVRVRAYAGGSSFAGAAAVNGATLLGWTSHGPSGETGAWAHLVETSSWVGLQPPYLPPPPATLLDWTSPTAEDARRLITTRDGLLVFQVRPSAGSAAAVDGAAVALDYIEVRVRYAP